MMDCSSEKVDCSSLAMYVARAEEAEFSDGIDVGTYVISRTGDWGLSDAEFASPGFKYIVSIESGSGFPEFEDRVSPLGLNLRRR